MFSHSFSHETNNFNLLLLTVIFLLVAAYLQCSMSLSQLSTRVLYFYWWQHAYNIARVCHNCPLVCYIFIGGSMLTI